ncbi:MAG: hypothetical protein IKM60_00550 [Clostridia bacterium]|nr:hypothetical protein [Clostridia bacterium]
MRKILAIVLTILMLCAALVGCGKKEAVFQSGTISGNIYESEWLGIRYTAPAGMRMSTEEEIRDAMEIGNELLYEDGGDTEWEDVASLYEMMAADDTTGENINIVTEKPQNKTMDEEAYAELVKLQLQKMDGTSISIGSVEPCTIAGLEFLEMQYSMELYGVTFHQSMFLHKQGDRMVIMTATYFDELGRSLLLSGFSAM